MMTFGRWRQLRPTYFLHTPPFEILELSSDSSDDDEMAAEAEEGAAEEAEEGPAQVPELPEGAAVTPQEGVGDGQPESPMLAPPLPHFELDVPVPDPFHVPAPVSPEYVPATPPPQPVGELEMIEISDDEEIEPMDVEGSPVHAPAPADDDDFIDLTTSSSSSSDFDDSDSDTSISSDPTEPEFIVISDSEED